MTMDFPGEVEGRDGAALWLSRLPTVSRASSGTMQVQVGGRHTVRAATPNLEIKETDTDCKRYLSSGSRRAVVPRAPSPSTVAQILAPVLITVHLPQLCRLQS
jgi:hypothetical protein